MDSFDNGLFSISFTAFSSEDALVFLLFNLKKHKPKLQHNANKIITITNIDPDINPIPNFLL